METKPDRMETKPDLIYSRDYVISQEDRNILAVAICHKNISTTLANDVIPQVYNEQRCSIRSPLVKRLNKSIKTLGHECMQFDLCVHLNITRVASET